MRNVWKFDIGKLIVPTIFFDSDLLNNFAKKYDPITGWVKNHVGVNLFRFFPKLISKVFNINPNHVVHEKIEMDDL